MRRLSERTPEEPSTKRESELSSVKRQQILMGACATFRELGYERASVDAIAARAKVSKATIYNHFHDKQALFAATFDSESRSIREKFHALLETPSGDIEADLRRIAEQLLRLVSAPADVQRYRLICGEAERFPELGRNLFESTMAVGRQRMIHFFQAAHGQLEIHDPEDAAVDFAGLVIGDLSVQLHLGIVGRLSEALLSRNVERAVRTFLRAYPPTKAPTRSRRAG